MAWQPGESGNPAGRPVGAKNKLGERLVDDFLADWEQHGKDVIARCREEDPATYLRVAVRLLPRDYFVEVEAKGLSFLDVLLNTERMAREREAKAEGKGLPALPTPPAH